MALAPYPWFEEAAQAFASQIDRLPNAFLLYGPPGIGLYELADSFARALLCESPNPDGSACGRCAACALTAAGSHPDYKRVLSEAMCERYEVPYERAENERPDSKKKASREVRIHQIRALADFVGLNANRGGRRVIVIYPADMVRAEAAAALLKSMEEPPADLIYILAAEDIDAVLPTIRSRSRLLRVAVPPKAMALDFLRDKGVASPEEALALAGGAPLEALERNPAERLDAALERALLDMLERGTIAPDEILIAAPKSYSVPAFGLLLSRWSHDLMRTKSGLSPRYFIKRADALARLAARTDFERLSALEKLVASVRRSDEHPLNPKQVWESALLHYASLWSSAR